MKEMNEHYLSSRMWVMWSEQVRPLEFLLERLLKREDELQSVQAMLSAHSAKCCETDQTARHRANEQ